MDVMDIKDWGFSFTETEELNAYKLAYDYRNCRYGLIVEKIPSGWMVTIFNAFGASLKLKGSKLPPVPVAVTVRPVSPAEPAKSRAEGEAALDRAFFSSGAASMM